MLRVVNEMWKEGVTMKGRGRMDERGFWSRWAGAYDRFMNGSERLYDQMAAEMKERLSRNMNVLELACGTGMISQRIVGSVKSLEATDFSPEMIAEAKGKPCSSRLHFSVQDATDLPYADQSFDAVVIANALHIMPEPGRALEEIHRVLKPGGLLIAPTFVHGEGAGLRLRVRLLELCGFHTYHQWNGDELAAFVAGRGFAVDRRQTLGGGIAPMCYLEARRLDGGAAK